MKSAEELKEQVAKAIDANADKIGAIGDFIWKNPEPGFREFKTSALAVETLRGLGLEVKDGLAMTGMRADLDCGEKGPRFAILGEMDSLIIPAAKDADKKTGAFHGCGHHTHITSMLGAAMGLCLSGVAKDLSGAISFIGCPAEECIELEYRMKLLKQGRIKAIGGKPALIREGVFDDVDMAAMIHAAGGWFAAMDSNAFVMKNVRFLGKGAHAASPSAGINAMSAANLAIHGLVLMRDTFIDDPFCRVHGLISKCGESVNVIPDDVHLDYQLRASSFDSLTNISRKFDQVMKGCAAAMGAKVRITTVPGYYGMKNDPEMYECYLQNAKSVCGIDPDQSRNIYHDAGSTDMGDVAALMPAIHPFGVGAAGCGHTASYHVPDVKSACVTMAKLLAFLAVDLLCNHAELGRKIAEKKKNCMTREEYVKKMDSLK